jgi:hypothetical protein
MKLVLFHDNLSDEFINRYTNDNVTFIQINDNKYGLTSMNDIRFCIFHDYLLQHPEIKRVIISDAADVVFQRNMFEDIVEDKLYVAYDRTRDFNHYYLKDRVEKTYRSFEPFTLINKELALQAGLFAGSANKIIETLQLMRQEFDTLVDQTYNCNYIVYNHVVYLHMKPHLIFNKPIVDTTQKGIVAKCGKSLKVITWAE